MSNEELRDFLNKIAAAFPNFINRDSNKSEIIKAWESYLTGVSAETANDALSRYAKKSHFAPTPADILKMIDGHDKWNIREAIERNKKTYRRITGREWQECTN